MIKIGESKTDLVIFGEFKCSYYPCVNMKCKILRAELVYLNNGIQKIYNGSTLTLLPGPSNFYNHIEINLEKQTSITFQVKYFIGPDP